MNDEAHFVSEVRRVLDAGTADLGEVDAARLAAARRRALAARHRPARWFQTGLVAVAAGVIAVVVVWRVPEPVAPVPVLEDVELLTASEPMDLFEELDFYLWLAANDAG